MIPAKKRQHKVRKQCSYSVLDEVSLKLLVHKLIDVAWWEEFLLDPRMNGTCPSR